MKIGIIGNGIVGNATAKSYEGFADEVCVYDVVLERATHTLSQTMDCDLIFVCLPTPQKAGSLECDTSIVESFFANVYEHRRANFVLRSTVPIGFTRKMREKCGLVNLVHSPEFLTARTAVDDAANPVRNVIGYTDNACENPCFIVYSERWPKVAIFELSSDESEAVKMFQNAFSAIKIAAFNEFNVITKLKRMDWQRITEALLAGGWINPMHTLVPGPDGRYGFGGSCLPKDLASLLHEYGDAAKMCKAAFVRNLVDRTR